MIVTIKQTLDNWKWLNAENTEKQINTDGRA